MALRRALGAVAGALAWWEAARRCVLVCLWSLWAWAVGSWWSLWSYLAVAWGNRRRFKGL